MKKAGGTKKGTKWIALGSGAEHEWDGVKWVPTGNFPYGKNPMKLIKEPSAEGGEDR